MNNYIYNHMLYLQECLILLGVCLTVKNLVGVIVLSLFHYQIYL
jgi:hypothetical protein